MKKFKAAYTFLKYNLVIIFPAMAASIITNLVFTYFISTPEYANYLNQVQSKNTEITSSMINFLAFFLMYILFALLLQLIYMPLSGVLVEKILYGNKYSLKSYKSNLFKGVGRHFKSYAKAFLFYFVCVVAFIILFAAIIFISSLIQTGFGSSIVLLLLVLLLILFAVFIVFDAVAYLWYPVMFIEKNNLFDAVKLSWRAIKNKFWSLMGMYIFYFLILLSITMFASLAQSVPILGTIIAGAVAGSLIVYKLILYSLFYIENRDKSMNEIPVVSQDSQDSQGSQNLEG